MIEVTLSVGSSAEAFAAALEAHRSGVQPHMMAKLVGRRRWRDICSFATWCSAFRTPCQSSRRADRTTS